MVACVTCEHGEPPATTGRGEPSSAVGTKLELAASRPPPPLLRPTPVNGRVRTVGLRNEDPDEIMRQAILLRSSTGRKAALQVKTRQVSRNPSIQGPWTPAVQDALKQKQPLGA